MSTYNIIWDAPPRMAVYSVAMPVKLVDKATHQYQIDPDALYILNWYQIQRQALAAQRTA